MSCGSIIRGFVTFVTLIALGVIGYLHVRLNFWAIPGDFGFSSSSLETGVSAFALTVGILFFLTTFFPTLSHLFNSKSRLRFLTFITVTLNGIFMTLVAYFVAGGKFHTFSSTLLKGGLNYQLDDIWRIQTILFAYPLSKNRSGQELVDSFGDQFPSLITPLHNYIERIDDYNSLNKVACPRALYFIAGVCFLYSLVTMFTLCSKKEKKDEISIVEYKANARSNVIV